MRVIALASAVGLAGALAFVLGASEAEAKSAFDSAYGFERTWNTGMRLVRVDLGLKITEKDEGAGYLLFDYTSPESGKKPVPGSMEFIRSSGNSSVRVVVQIPRMPGYHEQAVIDSLARKLRSEFGDPPKSSPSMRAGDAGAESPAPAR